MMERVPSFTPRAHEYPWGEVPGSRFWLNVRKTTFSIIKAMKFKNRTETHGEILMSNLETKEITHTFVSNCFKKITDI